MTDLERHKKEQSRAFAALYTQIHTLTMAITALAERVNGFDRRLARLEEKK
jgi:hypothetical protein